MTVHPGAAAVQQGRHAVRAPIALVDGSLDGWRKQDQKDLGALAAHAQYPVAVFFAPCRHVGAGGLEDSQAEEPEHGHEGEVAGIAGLASGGEQGLELQVGEPERR